MTTVSFGAAEAIPPSAKKIESKKTSNAILLMNSPSSEIIYAFQCIVFGAVRQGQFNCALCKGTPPMVAIHELPLKTSKETK
jgi:hypothetical protein